MSPMMRVLLASTALASLAGCGDNAPPEEQQVSEGQLSGDVLGGAINDDMLPLESLRSQSPAAQGAGEGGADQDEEGDESEAD